MNAKARPNEIRKGGPRAAQCLKQRRLALDLLTFILRAREGRAAGTVTGFGDSYSSLRQA